jgi:hypothetical protein
LGWIEGRGAGGKSPAGKDLAINNERVAPILPAYRRAAVESYIKDDGLTSGGLGLQFSQRHQAWHYPGEAGKGNEN